MTESALEAISLASVMLKVPAGTRGNYSDKRKIGSTLLCGARGDRERKPGASEMHIIFISRARAL